MTRSTVRQPGFDLFLNPRKPRRGSYFCAVCGAKQALPVRTIGFRGLGGEKADWNGVTIMVCERCHGRAMEEQRHALEEAARADWLRSPEGMDAYADAIALYLAFAVDRLVAYCSTLATWDSTGGKARSAFPRQAMAMSWDYAEVNPFDLWPRFVDAIAEVIERSPIFQRETPPDYAEVLPHLTVALDGLCLQLDRERKDNAA